jgi:hypothetical protein
MENRRRQESATIAYFMRSLTDPSNTIVLTLLAKNGLSPDHTLTFFRGHLRMPDDALASEHSRVISKFKDRLRYQQRKLGAVIELIACPHITDPDNAHYDITVYSTLNPEQTREIIRDAWIKSGGHRYSLPELKPGEIDPWVKYSVKDTNQSRRKFQYLPKPKAEGGIRMWWTGERSKDGGFWQGRSFKALWKELVAHWQESGLFDLPKDEANIHAARKFLKLLPKDDPYTILTEWRFAAFDSG